MCERGQYKLVHEFNMFIVSRSKTGRERERWKVQVRFRERKRGTNGNLLRAFNQVDSLSCFFLFFFFFFFLILGLKCSHKLKYKKKEIGNST
jgi:hypothetical protein